MKSTFLNEYLEQPMSYVAKWNENKYLKQKLTLNRLKQAPRVWNSRIDKYFQDNNFIKCPHKHALCIKLNENSDVLLVFLYVDNFIFT